jgi:hypothetical protein
MGLDTTTPREEQERARERQGPRRQGAKVGRAERERGCPSTYY